MAAAEAAESMPRRTPSTQPIGAFVKTPGAIFLDVMAPGDTEKGRFCMFFGDGCISLGPCKRIDDPCEDCPFIFEDGEEDAD